ncbi:uncharacterized protein PHALS_06389 [Plasmopara halstedii]|uniref:Uncharacterized protein n=1 Tax=Plasmopara halstedii TaxID=4781 RepID=A0A0P1B1F6_PLAHL|nr:uncharacterized protein PHALS_06389 [Plasmopara halstedii]CEG48573.1 hypothetical protein PHALS_06389 [Plasmopara halstedii]|eukprot:XP_024584942.1 hypothetical protein PHALS_06389 [Plasmopara halstedii]
MSKILLCQDCITHVNLRIYLSKSHALKYNFFACFLFQVYEYLLSTSVSDNEPVMALHWNENALPHFVNAAKYIEDDVVMPKTARQHHTRLVVKDVIASLTTKASGRVRYVLLVSNSVVQ